MAPPHATSRSGVRTRARRMLTAATSTLAAATLAVTGLAIAGPGAPASATPRTPVAHPVVHRAPHPVAGRYTNPLPLVLPNGHHAESCADPFVLHGQTRGDRTWYLYCTSDVLDSTQKSATGGTVMHTLPTYRSTDLTHWTYVNDAVASTPSWVGANGMWAPDVTYANGKYHLYYTASNTTLTGGGSAVGVLTSTSPTGPWTDSGKPVVAPGGTASDPASKRWNFDPEVLTTNGHSYLYFGSYFGGVYVRELTADGLSTIASTERQIAIDNRYEGTFIVKHGGWYYFMGSATNCCAGPLTGYTVFTARSRSPLGPFVDRSGVAITAPRVGGTPLVFQNGNRWVGTGHNAVVTDYAGQDWVFYHGVDRNDPYYAGQVGYTKRPLLLDPLDWRGGWPVVRGNAGPSDHAMPGPAAQPGWRTAYRPHVVTAPKAGAPVRRLDDGFGASTLSKQWTWVRQPAASTWSVGGGKLTWQTQAADIHPPATSLASLLTEKAPRGAYMVQVKVSTTVPNSGCCQNYAQGALFVYGDDGHYVKLASASIWNTRQTEFGYQDSSQPAGYPTYGNSVVGPVGATTWLRIVRHRVEGHDAYSAYTSLDGRRWVGGVTWAADLGSNPRIALSSFGAAGFSATFSDLRVMRLA